MSSKVAVSKKHTPELAKNISRWLYLALFFFCTGFGIYQTALVGGSSDPKGIANYSILSMIVLIPILTLGNTQSPNAPKEVLRKWLGTVGTFLFGMLIYVPFVFVLSNFGVFRFWLYFNTILNVVIVGLALVSVYQFIAYIFQKKILAAVCSYGFAAAIIAIEFFSVDIQSQGLYKVFYALSVTKYSFGLQVGILDLKSLSFFLCIAALFLLLTLLLMAKRAGKPIQVKTWQGKTQLVLTAITALFILYSLITPNGTAKGIDMTPVRIFTPGYDTFEYIDALDVDVNITVLEPKQDFIGKHSYTAYFLQVGKVIETLAKRSPHITLQYVDLEKNPDIVKEHEEANPQAGDILVALADQSVLLPSEYLFGFTYLTDEQDNVYQQITSVKAEQEICSAIEAMRFPLERQIVFLLGYKEHENYKVFVQLLRENGYEVSTVNVSEGQIPDAKLAVIFAPTEDYTDSGIVNEFLYNEEAYSRNLLYVANSDCTLKLGNLDVFLDNWGLCIEQKTIKETDVESFTRNDPMYGINEYVETSHISSYNYLVNPVVVPFSRNIVVDELADNLFYQVLLQSKETSSLLTNGTLSKEKTNYNTTVISSFLQKNVFGDSYTGIAARVAAIGSEYAFALDVLTDAQYSNALYFIDVIDELLGRNEVRVPIVNRNISLRAVEMPDGIRTIFMIFFVIVLPLLMVAIGILYIIRQKCQRMPCQTPGGRSK